MATRRPARKRFRDLKEYLEKTNQTQGEYAARLGVSQPLVSAIVNGAPVSRKLAAAIHADTGISLEELMQLKSEARRGA